MVIKFTVEVDGFESEFVAWYAGAFQWETGLAVDNCSMSFDSFDTLGEALQFLQYGA